MPKTSTELSSTSPNLPKKSYELPTYITLTMGVLERLSSRMAIKFALKLFFTPLQFNIPNREKTIYNLARRQQMMTDKNIGFEFFEWGDSRNESILLVHGWSGRGTQFFALIQALLDQNYHIVSFDAPAHGQSKRKQTNLLEFTDCIRRINEEYGPLNKAAGHSLGGAAIFNSINLGVPIQKVITIGTPVNIRSVIADFCEKVHASNKVGEGINEHIEKTFKVDTREISNDYLATKHQPKGLIIHDTEDIDVGVHNAYKLHEAWPASELIISSGLGHRRVLNDPDLISKMMDVLTS